MAEYDRALAGAPTEDDKTWAMFAHLASLANMFFPLGAIFGPLIVWLVKRDQSPYVDHHGKESLQFQASFLAYHLVLTCGGGASFGGLLLLAMAGGPKGPSSAIAPAIIGGVVVVVVTALMMRLFVVVMMIWAAVQAKAGVLFRYPGTIRFF